MSDDLLTRLQAMFHSGKISSYLAAKMPHEKLSPGWVEKGLLAKGLKGKLESKKIQEDLIIPIDRFVRLVNEINRECDLGFVILGPDNSSKDIVIIDNQSTSSDSTSLVYGLLSNDLQLSEVHNSIIRLFTNESSKSFTDFPIDYIEELKTKEEVTHLLSLTITNGKSKPINTLKKKLKPKLDSDSILARIGNINEIVDKFLIFSKWIFGLKILQKKNIRFALICLVESDTISLYFLDTVQNIISFAKLKELLVSDLFVDCIRPFWNPSEKKTHGPRVIVESSQGEIKINEESESVSDSQSIVILRTKLNGIIKRISPLLSQLIKYKEKISKITTGFSSPITDENFATIIQEFKHLENETQNLEKISRNLRKLEKLLSNEGNSGKETFVIEFDQVPKIVSKMTALRNLIDRIETEFDQLSKKTSEIESLNFKKRIKN